MRISGPINQRPAVRPHRVGHGAVCSPPRHCAGQNSRAVNPEAITVVATDDVLGAGRRAADRIIGRSARDVDPLQSVAQIQRAGDIRADVVARNRIPCRTLTVELDAIVRIATDDVACRCRGAADNVP